MSERFAGLAPEGRLRSYLCQPSLFTTSPARVTIRQATPASDVLIHGIGRQVDITGPSDGSVVNKDLLKEEAFILQRRKSTDEILPTQLDTPTEPVLKADK